MTLCSTEKTIAMKWGRGCSVKFCLAHFRWEVWIDGLCYAWLTGEADDTDREWFWAHFVSNVHLDRVPVIPLDPQPIGCRFEERLTA